MSTRKGVWDLQQVRDKYLQELWVNSNQLMVWGSNAYGGLGLNEAAPVKLSSPTQIPGTTWADINPNGKSTSYFEGDNFVMKTDGTLWAWGDNDKGQLGVNNIVQYSSPIQVGSDTNWAYATGGNNNAMGIKTDGTGWAWGNNYNGKLGINSNTYMSSPTQIPGTNWSRLSAARYQGYGIKTDGTLWAWGYNNDGQLGQNNRTDYSSPTQIPGTTWSDIASSQVTVATKTDGTLWSWGYGSNGELGLNDRHKRSSPVQVPGTTWASVQANNYNVQAIKTDGTMWVWGYNTNGQLAQNDRTHRSSPVQIPGTTWSKGSVGASNLWGIKTDGSLWTWGWNATGALGLNTQGTSAPYYGTQYPQSKSSPTQLGTSSDWVLVGGHMGYGGRAGNSKGEIWSWGAQSGSSFGLSYNDATQYSSPVQATGTGSSFKYSNEDNSFGSGYGSWNGLVNKIPATDL